MSPSGLEKCSDDPCGRQVTLEVSPLELFRRANTYSDLQAWAAFQQSLLRMSGFNRPLSRGR